MKRSRNDRRGPEGTGQEGEAGIVVTQHGGYRFDVHTILERQGSEGVPEIVEAENTSLRYNNDKKPGA